MSEQKTEHEVEIECVRPKKIQGLSDSNGQATQHGGEATSRGLHGKDHTAILENDGLTQKVARSAIAKVLTVLVDYMNPTTILERMIETDLLRRSTLDDIKEQKTSSERSRCLLKEVSRKDVTVYIHFKNCLRETKQEHIVRLLEIAEKGGDTEDAMKMIKQEAMELSSEENKLFKELSKTIDNLDLKKKMIICYIYVYIGGDVCNKLFKKIVNDLRPQDTDPLTWTVDTFLRTNRNTIEKIKSMLPNEKIDLVFPKANLELWDVSIFCIILINTCKVSPSIRICLEWMLERGKKLAKYDRSNYERKFGKMKNHILTIAAETGDEELTRKMTKLLDQLESGVIPNTECAIITNKIGLLFEEVKSSRDAMEQHASATQAEIIKGNQNIERKLDGIHVDLRKLNQFLCDLKIDSLPASRVKIILQNCSSEAEKVTSPKIVESFNNCGNPSKLTDACDELKIKFKTNGYSVVSAEIGCVQLNIHCTSAVSLINLLRDYVKGRLDASLEPLENAARSLDGCTDLKLEAVIFEEDFLNALSFVETMTNYIIKRTGLQDFDTEEKKEQITHTIEIKEKHMIFHETERGLDSDVENNKRPTATCTIILPQERKINDIENIDDIAKKNEELLDKIVKLCECTDDPEVIMLIGRSGAGKSALINTIHKVITGEYYQIKKQGSGHAKPVTLELKRILVQAATKWKYKDKNHSFTNCKD